MKNKLSQDLKHLDTILDQVKNQASVFLDNINERPTSSSTNIVIDTLLANQGLGAKQTLDHFIEKFNDVIVASTGPRYWGYVTGGSTPAAIAGDWLASVYDQNTQTIIS